ncbi:MAG TPA: hypothetical protein VGF96_02440 [Terracidiphilus sp.]|jgi:hypothetical protein
MKPGSVLTASLKTSQNISLTVNLTSEGGFTSTAAPGTYVVQVIGTGTNTQVIHYQNVSLTITN